MNQSRFLRSNTRLSTSIALFLIATSCARGFGGNDVAVKVADLSEHFHDVIPSGLAFSPDGRYIAINSDHENINVWEWRKNRIERILTRPEGFGGTEAANALVYSPDGRLLANSEGPGEGHIVVRLWDTTTWKIKQDITDAGVMTSEAVSFTPDSQFLLRTANRSGSLGDALIVHSIGTWERAWAYTLAGFEPFSLAVSPNGEFAAVAGSIIVFPENVADRIARVQQMKYEPTINIVDLRLRKIARVIHGDAMGPIGWSPDGARLAVAGREYVEIFDSRSGETLVHTKVEKSGTMNVRFTPDGRYFVESDLNGMGRGLGVKIWDSRRQNLLQSIPGDIGSIGVSRDGKYLAVGTTGRTTIWQFTADEVSHK